MARILITGATGMVGSHLLEFYAPRGTGHVVGSYFSPTIRLAEIGDRFGLVELDVRQSDEVTPLPLHPHGVSKVAQDQRRSTDDAMIFGRTAHRKVATGWRLKTALEQTIRSVLHYEHAQRAA